MNHGLEINLWEIVIYELYVKHGDECGPDGFDLDVGKWFSDAAMPSRTKWNVTELLLT